MRTKIDEFIHIFSKRQYEYLESLLDGVEAGEQGLSAFQVWQELGNEGTESDFINSLQGSSAYEIWLENGGVGDETAFLNSLVGPAGAGGGPSNTLHTKIEANNTFQVTGTNVEILIHELVLPRTNDIQETPKVMLDFMLVTNAIVSNTSLQFVFRITDLNDVAINGSTFVNGLSLAGNGQYLATQNNQVTTAIFNIPSGSAISSLLKMNVHSYAADQGNFKLRIFAKSPNVNMFLGGMRISAAIPNSDGFSV